MFLLKDENDSLDFPLSAGTGQAIANAGALVGAAVIAWVMPTADYTATTRYMALIDESETDIAYFFYNSALTAHYVQIVGASSSTNSYQGTQPKLEIGKWNLIAMSFQLADAGVSGVPAFRWAHRSETTVTPSSSGPGLAAAAGTITTPTRLRLYGMNGAVWGPVIIRTIAANGYSLAEHDAVWATRQAYGAMTVDDAGQLNGSTGCIYACGHAMMPRPFDAGSGPLLMPGYTVDQGAPIYDANAAQFGTPELVGRGFAAIGGTPQFVSHEDQPWRSMSDLFQRSTTWTGYDSYTPVPKGGGSTHCRRFVHRQPAGLVRVAVRGNSRTVIPTDGGYGYPGNYTGAWYRELEALAAGVDFAPLTSNDSVNQNTEGIVTFGFSRSWGVVPDADSGAFVTNPPFSVGRYCTNRNDGWSIMAAGKHFRLLAKPQGLATIDQPLHQVIHYLKFPGGGRFQIFKARDTGQEKTVNEWQDDGGIVQDTNLAAVCTVTLDATQAASYNATAKTIVLTGVGLRIVIGQIAAKGLDLAHVASAVEAGGNTTVTFDHPFDAAPITGDVIKIGPWAYGKYEFDHDPVTDISEWRGFRIYTDDTAPVIFLGVGSWNPNADGFIWLAAGMSGEGFTPQLANWNTSATSVEASPRRQFHELENADLNLLVDQGQDSEPSSTTDMMDDLLAATPGAEFILLGDWVWGYPGADASGAATWAAAVSAIADSSGWPFASGFHVGGNSYDKAIDGDWHDSGNHSSNRGGKLVVREWVSQLQSVVSQPEATGPIGPVARWG